MQLKSKRDSEIAFFPHTHTQKEANYFYKQVISSVIWAHEWCNEPFFLWKRKHIWNAEKKQAPLPRLPTHAAKTWQSSTKIVSLTSMEPFWARFVRPSRPTLDWGRQTKACANNTPHNETEQVRFPSTCLSTSFHIDWDINRSTPNSKAISPVIIIWPRNL